MVMISISMSISAKSDNYRTFQDNFGKFSISFLVFVDYIFTEFSRLGRILAFKPWNYIFWVRPLYSQCQKTLLAVIKTLENIIILAFFLDSSKLHRKCSMFLEKMVKTEFWAFILWVRLIIRSVILQVINPNAIFKFRLTTL